MLLSVDNLSGSHHHSQAVKSVESLHSDDDFRPGFRKISPLTKSNILHEFKPFVGN